MARPLAEVSPNPGYVGHRTVTRRQRHAAGNDRCRCSIFRVFRVFRGSFDFDQQSEPRNTRMTRNQQKKSNNNPFEFHFGSSPV